MNHEYIIAYADKSVLKISGLNVKGLNTKQLEEIIAKKLNTLVRVIGVTGDNIEMDVYGIEPEYVRKNEKGLIESIAFSEGITVTELTKIVCSNKIVEVDYSSIPQEPISDCAKERWMRKK